jgi:amidophosphoribosyltransferase
VRGTTSLKIVQMMRDAGASEVHMRIASPPTEHSCFYGVDTPERSKLLAAAWIWKRWPTSSRPTAWPSSPSTASIAPWASKRNKRCPQFCDACFTGEYPTRLTDYDAQGRPVETQE